MNPLCSALHCLAALLLTASAHAGVVIQPEVNTDGKIPMKAGESASVDLFASWDGVGDADLIDGVGLYLEVNDSSGLASNLSAPTIGVVSLIGGDLPWSNSVNNDGTGTTRRFQDAVSLADITLTLTPLKFASVILDATHLANTGEFSLRFSHDNGNLGVTQFVLDGNPLTPLVEGAGGNVSASTATVGIEVTAVPEPSACWLVGLLAALTASVRWMGKRLHS